jgi:hypothetical protein
VRSARVTARRACTAAATHATALAVAHLQVEGLLPVLLLHVTPQVADAAILRSRLRLVEAVAAA